MIEKIKELITHNYWILIPLVILLLFCRSCGVSTGTNNTVERIEADAAGAGADIDSGRKDVESATEEIGGAGIAVATSQDIIEGSIQSIREGRSEIEECRELIKGSLYLNRRSQEIMSEVETGYRRGTPAGQERKTKKQ